MGEEPLTRSRDRPVCRVFILTEDPGPYDGGRCRTVVSSVSSPRGSRPDSLPRTGVLRGRGKGFRVD